MIQEGAKELIRKANLAAIVAKVKSGKVLTKGELAIVDEQEEPPKIGRPRSVSVHSLSQDSGIDMRTLRKRLVDAGCYPPDKHPLAKVLEAIRPKQGNKTGDAIKDKKVFEEWRKLKIRNDAAEGVLIKKSSVCESIRRLGPKIDAMLENRLANEYPATVAGLDVPAAREYGKKLADQIREQFRALAQEWKG